MQSTSTVQVQDLRETASSSVQASLTQAAAALAYAGALPLLLAALMVWARPDDLGPPLTSLIIIYGGVLLAFFGGVRWGIAVMHPGGPTFRNLSGAVLPLMVAMPVFLLPQQAVALAILVLALPLLLADDLKATRKGSGAPDWYLGVRLPLTLMMEIALLATLLRVVIG